VIVVVTGPSAAGKTTWCRRHFPDRTVPDRYDPTLLDAILDALPALA
jgi:GTPase SAR1 family protein